MRRFPNAPQSEAVGMTHNATVSGGAAQRGMRFRRLFLLLLIVMGALGPAPGRAEDGHGLLTKVLQTYQHLNTYQGVASVQQTLLYKGKPLQSNGLQVEMKAKRPNKLFLSFVNPNGTRTVVSDGKDFDIYSAKLNQYTRTPTLPTFKQMFVPLLFGRAGVQAGLDPLYFLVMDDLPQPLTGLKLKGSDTFNGKPVFVVTGVTRTIRKVVKGPNGQQAVLPATLQNWTWWINKQTLLLEKIESRDANVTIRVPVRQGKKVVARALTVTRVLTHIVTSATPNPPLNDDAFAFRPPAGAVERKSTQELLNGK